MGVVAADTSHYKENECMRLAMENILYQAGVDIVLNGHCHEYERSNPVYVCSFLPSVTLNWFEGLRCCNSPNACRSPETKVTVSCITSVAVFCI